MRRTAPLLALTAVLAACSPAADTVANDGVANSGVLSAGPETTISNVAAANLPEGLAALVEATVSGVTISKAERKEREGRIYYDVEGTKPDGSEVEIDVLQGADGKLTALEVQRDIDWPAAPAEVRAAAAAKKDAFTPERVIESRQVEGGETIYELFAPGKPKEPAMEVRWQNGRAEVLGERWAH